MAETNVLSRQIGGISVDRIVLALLDYMIWPTLAITIVAVALTVPETFRNVQSIELMLHGSVGLGFVTLAASVALLGGYFDLSVGAMAGFTAMFTGLMISSSGWNVVHDPWAGFLIISLAGLLTGAFNGVMISKVDVDPFLQTLAMFIILNGATVTLSAATVTNLPDTYTLPGGENHIAIGLLLLSYLAVAVFLKYTSLGQAVYGMGSSEESARAVGINTDRLTIFVYALSGFFAAMGGLMLTGFVGVVSPRLGDGLLFPAFAAAVIGGISLYGGRGRITGALGGVLLLGLIQSALNLSGVQTEQIQLANGIVLLVAILLYNSRKQIRERILLQEA